MRRLRSKGFTLIEMVIVIVILGIIAAAGSYALREGLTAYFTSQDITEANWQALYGLEKMSRQIRAIRSSADITTATSSQLTFTDTSGNSVNYQLSGTDLLLNGSPLISGVSSLTFSYLTANSTTATTIATIRYVTIALTVNQNDATYNIRTTVYARRLS